MPVKYFVDQNPPDYTHENRAVIEIIKRVYEKFNHEQALSALVANLNKQDAYADLVILTERGLGVVELKGYTGLITQKGPIWYAGSKVIGAGSKNTPARNPHEQVQAYTATIRGKLMDYPPRSDPWLPGRKPDWEEFKYNTAVCFTDPKANFDAFRQQYPAGKLRQPWENFSLLTPAEIPEWVASLRFEAKQGLKQQFAPYRLNPKQITRIVTQVLGATEWTEIANLMPTGQPYAYLFLKSNNEVFGLTADEVIIGRDPATCQVTLPKPPFERVSRQHAKIIRRLDGVYVQDLDSTNGTYLNGQRLTQPAPLRPGYEITLGGPQPGDKVCRLEFSFEPTAPSVTELMTQF